MQQEIELPSLQVGLTNTTKTLNRSKIDKPSTSFESLNNELLDLIDIELGKPDGFLIRLFGWNTTTSPQRLERMNAVLRKISNILQSSLNSDQSSIAPNVVCFEKNVSGACSIVSYAKDLDGEASAMVAETHNSRLSILKSLETTHNIKQGNLEQKKLDFSVSMIHSRIESFDSIKQNISSLKLIDLSGHISDFIGVLQSTILFFNDYAKNDKIAEKKVYREYILRSIEIIMSLMEAELKLAGLMDNQAKMDDVRSNISSIAPSATNKRLNVVPKPHVAAWLKNLTQEVGLQEPQMVEQASSGLAEPPEKPQIVAETKIETEELKDTVTHLESDTRNQESQSSLPENQSSFNEPEKILTTLLELTKEESIARAQCLTTETEERRKCSLKAKTNLSSLTKQYQAKLLEAQKNQFIARENTTTLENNTQDTATSSIKNRP